jgi:hypothetical protein
MMPWDTKTKCRGYFILLSLLWGIYVDKALVCISFCIWQLLACMCALSTRHMIPT